MSDIEGKAAREAVSESGQRASFNLGECGLEVFDDFGDIHHFSACHVLRGFAFPMSAFVSRQLPLRSTAKHSARGVIPARWPSPTSRPTALRQ
jgi:hypothetical protein